MAQKQSKIDNICRYCGRKIYHSYRHYSDAFNSTPVCGDYTKRRSSSPEVNLSPYIKRDDEPYRVGVKGLWLFPEDHPWQPHAVIHDKAYDDKDRWWFKDDWVFFKGITKDNSRDFASSLWGTTVTGTRLLMGFAAYPVITTWNIGQSIRSYFK